MKSLRYYLPIAAVLVAFASLTACNKKAEPSVTPEAVRGIQVFQTTSQKLPETVDTVGTIRAAESAVLSSQVMGTVASVAVREGDHVRTGQPLISIEAAQLVSQTGPGACFGGSHGTTDRSGRKRSSARRKHPKAFRNAQGTEEHQSPGVRRGRVPVTSRICPACDGALAGERGKSRRGCGAHHAGIHADTRSVRRSCYRTKGRPGCDGDTWQLHY